MLRRGVGIAAVRKKQEQAKQFSEVGDQLAESQIAHISSQLELFRTNLQQFAIKYKNNIKKDPDFRKKFQIMCSKIGVDPLASKKGFWSELLDVGDFYYELAVQIIEVCILTRPKNGGLIGMNDLLRLLSKRRSPAMQKVSDDDVKRAVKKLSVLGEGFQLIEMEERTMIVTVPIELSPDHSTIIALAQNTGGMVNVSILARELGWDGKRSTIALNVLLREGMAWIDEQPTEPSYYLPIAGMRLFVLPMGIDRIAQMASRKKFVCAYCNKSFDDSQEARRRHFSGRNHKMNVKLWYDSFEDQAQRKMTNNAGTRHAPNTANEADTAAAYWANLPPSMIPAPPDAFAYVRTDWG
ncbi:TPA: hypothetical protein N0F65_003560 [Lagenidium giganteum]|uniref:Matrin-type domain-containing protein n=1 Tax=Lagenidium giganteum TaxID=4803 RepID=A0AAV2Z2Z3_9STRA|nr:TPA: hypothetical protein N0F65_003560 [Lagenidium giganteum]